jgi:hypothetical protein
MTQARVRLSDFNDIPDLSLTTEEILAPPDSWTPINLADLADKPPVLPVLGNVGIVYPGKRHVFSGPQESAKTIAAYAIGIETIRNNGPIIIIDLEMGQWEARDRLRDLGATPDELAQIRYIEPHEPATQERIDKLVALRAVLVIIDAAAGAYDIQGLDDNRRADVERFTRIYVHSFWKHDIATIVLDHVVKNLDNRGKYAIGSERKTGGTDVHLGFDTITPIKRGTTGMDKITTHKDRGGHLKRGKLAELHLASNPDTHHITWEFQEAEDSDEVKRPTILMHRVSKWLQEQDEPKSVSKIKEHVQGEDAWLAIAADFLVQEGYATIEHGPRNAKLICHKELYIDQPAPLRPSIHAETEMSQSQPTVSSRFSTPATPASPLRAGVQTTPAAASIAAGDERVNEPVTPARPIDVHDPAVQAQLDDYDSDIPFKWNDHFDATTI